MADGHSSGTLDLTEIDYSEWNPEGSPVSIHMHLDAVDGILRDLNENIAALEVGGLLLGRVVPAAKAGDKPGVWIDRYERIPCAYKLGPRFLLDAPDQVALEQAAGSVLASGELAVVGLYRSHLRDGFDLEGPDFELIRRYFSDSSDLVLLIKPRSPSDVSARFYVHDEGAGARPAGEPFPLRGRVLNPPEPVVRERPRRLVPDFDPKIAETRIAEPRAEAPSPEKPVMPPLLFMPRERDAAEDLAPTFGERLKKWLPLLPALLLAAGGIWWFAQSPNHRAAPEAPAAAANQIARPLGLAVEPMGSAWQVSWNPNATALHDAHSVQLFVRAGDDQNRIDLSPHDLSAGIYKYEPAGTDVTFRLEVVESSGRISAESFRFVRGDLQRDATAVAAHAAKAAAIAPTAPVRRTEPKVIRRAPPVIAAGIRPRLTSPVALDVHVEIDARGRVTSAAPVVKPRKGLDAYLAEAAVKAARLWRFEPARENGKPVAGDQTLHFVFQQ